MGRKLKLIELNDMPKVTWRSWDLNPAKSD